MKSRPLNQKQKRFLAEYLVDMNATQAAIRAGYSKKTAYSMGSKLLKKGEAQALLAQMAERNEVTVSMILNERRKMAFFDPRLLFHANGKPKAAHELDEDTAAAISGIEVEEKTDGTISYKYRFASKSDSLAAFEKIKGMYRDEPRTPFVFGINLHLGDEGPKKREVQVFDVLPVESVKA